MKVLKFFGNTIGITLAALAGNYVGDVLRERATGEKGHQFHFSQEGEDGETVIAINPNLTNFLPAVLAGALNKPRLAWAFLVGAALSGFYSDKYEQKAKDWVKSRVPDEQKAKDWVAAHTPDEQKVKAWVESRLPHKKQAE